jgi:RNA polymerase sigma-70 factor (ECF subfamily)
VEALDELVARAQQGDLAAYGRLVQATQSMAHAVARRVVGDSGLAQDVSQEAYLRAYPRLRELQDSAAFAGWLRRIVISVALNMRRGQRLTLLRLDDVPDVPVLDEEETTWSQAQRQRLAGALLTLTREERRLCDRRYYGGWSTAQLANDAGVEDAAMRKRLQRIRDKLRKEMEMAEQGEVRPGEIRPDFPARVVELLARPRLTDLPENPVGRILEVLRSVYADFSERELPEVIDLAEARRTISEDALYVQPGELHRIDDDRALRYDLTLPLLLTARSEGHPLRIWSAGKVYRAGLVDATHLETFHQAEVFWLDERSRLDPWQFTGRVLQSLAVMFPGRAVKVVPTSYPMCSQAWEAEVENHGHWWEVLAWGVFTDRIVHHLGADPGRCIAVGAGYGIERLAMLRYGIDDIRKIDVASVA